MRIGGIPCPAFAIVLASLVTSVAGQTTDQQRLTALKIIAEHVRNVCPTPSVVGHRTTLEANALVKADLKGLTQLLADVGGEIGAHADTVSWSGVAQEHIADAISSSYACSVRMHELLIPKFLPESASAAPSHAERSPAARAEDDPDRRPYVTGSIERVAWFNNIHSTVEGCLQSLRNSRSLECRQLPEKLVCSFAAFGDNPPLPDCFWTAQECQSNYDEEIVLDRSRSILSPPPRSSVQQRPVRARCVEVAWADAARQYQTWREATLE